MLRDAVVGALGRTERSLQRRLAAVWLAGCAGLAGASPVVVDDSACPRYAVDIAAFATCDGDRVAVADVTDLASMLLDEAAVPASQRTRAGLYVDAAHAYRLRHEHPDVVVLVDVRSAVDVSLSGDPELVDLHVPYRELVRPLVRDAATREWTIATNRDFAQQLDERLQRRGATRESIVMLICRSGERSAQAANALSDAGYRRVVNVVDGVDGDIGDDGRRTGNGWKHAGLPWTGRVDNTLPSAAR